MANTNQVIVNGKTILDLRSDTVTPKTLQKGITAHDKSGAKITGTLTVPGQETRNVELNMQSGNQAIVSSTGMLMKQVTVVKPGTFLPENIKKGVNIGGVIGTLEASPSGGAKETWVLNEYIDPLDHGEVTYSTDFTSNNNHFNSIRYTDSAVGVLYYNDILVFGGRPAVIWKDQAYRKITFSVPPSGDLLTWLEANAVKQANDTAVQPSKSVSITSNGTISVTPDAPYDALGKAEVSVNVASGGGEDDLITFDIEVDFSNCPDAEVTVWESLDKDHNLTSNNHAVELKVQRGAVIAVTSSNLIAGATTEENASFDIAGVEGEYEHTYDSAEYASLSTWTYLVAVNTGGNDNFAYLVLSMRKG